MMRSLIASVVVAAAVLTTGGPAAAMSTGPATAVTDLTLSYMADAGYARAVTLTCRPDAGAHPEAGAACDTLRKVGGKPQRLKAADTMCTMEYAPITAQITGRWTGRKLAWTKKYGNTCEMTRATGVLFEF